MKVNCATNTHMSKINATITWGWQSLWKWVFFAYFRQHEKMKRFDKQFGLNCAVNSKFMKIKFQGMVI